MCGWVHFYGICITLSSSRATAILSSSGIRPIVVRRVLWTLTLWSKWGSWKTPSNIKYCLKPSLKCVIFWYHIYICYFEGLWTWSADPEFPPTQMCLPILWFRVMGSYTALTWVRVQNPQVSGTVDPVITDVLIMLATGLEGFMDRVLASSCLSPIVR